MTAYVVTGLGFGDEGKGTITDYLTHHTPGGIVVRHSGGAQALHHVVTPDGRTHGFSQWGSGTLNGTRTHLTQYMFISPTNMVHEAERLEHLGVRDPFHLLSVSPYATVITPWHVMINQVVERARAGARHGSTGQGVGEAADDRRKHPSFTIYARDLWNDEVIRDKLAYWRFTKLSRVAELGLAHLVPEQYRDPDLNDVIAGIFSRVGTQLRIMPDVHWFDPRWPQTVIFEGAHGVLLDEWWGTYPYNTWTTTTTENAFQLLDGQHGVSLGVIRTYATRHGDGPFPTEGSLTISEPHNQWGELTGAFRTGALDLMLLRYALKVAGRIDALAVTHMDVFSRLGRQSRQRIPVCRSYIDPHDRVIHDLPVGTQTDLNERKQFTHTLNWYRPVYDWWSEDELVGALEAILGIPVVIASYGPTYEDKKAL